MNSMFAKLTLVDGGIKTFIRSLDTARSTTDAGHLPAESKAERPENRQQGFASLLDIIKRALADTLSMR